MTAELMPLVHLRTLVHDNGRRCVFQVSQEAIDRTDRWSPGSEPPPLPVTEAVKRATARATELSQGNEQLNLCSIELAPVTLTEFAEQWFYVICFDPLLEGRPNYEKTIYVVLLMDGTVVSPTESREHDTWDGAA